MTPANVFQPGTPLTVGSHKISITKYISEGGFAHVYSCTIDPPFNGSRTACLKRVVVPNKWQLTLLRQEVDAMKRLRGNAHIVSYIDSHALRLPSPVPDAPQQYEVLLLMEYCSGKGLIDLMNTRLTNRLTEPEILSIMGQITTAVAMCHHLSPPLIHRDIKIENVLIDAKGTYKLCDFGSAVEYSKVPANANELSRLHNDIMQNTTPQYRAPEMIDLARGFPIDDKLDIWALGIFLYKLCYYTTPFELPHQKSLQDLQHLILLCLSNLRFPGSPMFSARLQNIIGCCLREDPRRRPNALQLLQEVSLMQNVSQIPDVVPYSVRLAKSGHHHDSVKPTSSNHSASVKSEAITSNEKLRKSSPPKDVFSTIDKSKIMSMRKSSRTTARPKSEIYSSASASSLQELIKLQVSESNTDLSSMRKSEDLDRGTMDFLRSKDSQGGTSRQNTGGSIKASIKNGLRRISTGGSISSHRSGSGSGSNSRTFSSGDSSSEEHLKVPKADGSKRKSSIQRRVQLLLSNKEKSAPKTASGYGKYTDQDDISAINFNNLSANASAESLSSAETYTTEKFDFKKSGEKRNETLERKESVKPNGTSRASSPSVLLKVRSGKPSFSTPPPCPPSLSVHSSTSSIAPYTPKKASSETAKKRAPPPKPTKPLHLKNVNGRRLSTSSEISLPDLDDLEKQFARRFPSYV